MSKYSLKLTGTPTEVTLSDEPPSTSKLLSATENGKEL
jgi:hypothetical protein